MGFEGFVDAFAPLPESSYVGLLAVLDTDLPQLGTGDDAPGTLRVVLTGGAGQLTGPVDLCARRGLDLAVLDTTLRDLADPAGNARRVVAALPDLADGARLHVRVGGGDPTPAWLAALDVLAEVQAVVALPLGLGDPEPWIDAALDRELAVSLVGGTVEQAVAALRTTARLWGDGDDLAAARPWCRSWLADDGLAAVAGLAGLDGPPAP